MKMKYTEQAVETLDDAGSVIANKNIEIEQLRQRVQELEKERDELLAALEYAATRLDDPVDTRLIGEAIASVKGGAQGENERLRIALGCTKRDLIRMRCPDFFEGVKDGYENLFDGHLVSMIGLINDYAKQK